MTRATGVHVCVYVAFYHKHGPRVWCRAHWSQWKGFCCLKSFPPFLNLNNHYSDRIYIALNQTWPSIFLNYPNFIPSVCSPVTCLSLVVAFVQQDAWQIWVTVNMKAGQFCNVWASPLQIACDSFLCIRIYPKQLPLLFRRQCIDLTSSFVAIISGSRTSI